MYLFYYLRIIIIDYNITEVSTWPELFNKRRFNVLKNLLPFIFLVVVINCINYYLLISQMDFSNVVLMLFDRMSYYLSR